jgi:SAM-dependent methyltransferase
MATRCASSAARWRPPIADRAARDTAAALARYYDLDLADEREDIDMYLALARSTDGPILELAAGSGRIAVPLAAAGYQVTGVDIDAQMLDRARTAWAAAKAIAGGGSLDLVEGDITDLDLGRRFGLVILAFNSLLLLADRAAQLAALRVMAAHLDKGGRAIVDVWLPAPDDLVLYDGRLVLDWLRYDEATREQVSKTTSARYESATHSARVTTVFDAWQDGGQVKRTVRDDLICFIGYHELLDLWSRAGLSLDTVAGDCEMTPFSPQADRLVLFGKRVDG